MGISRAMSFLFKLFKAFFYCILINNKACKTDSGKNKNKKAAVLRILKKPKRLRFTVTQLKICMYRIILGFL